MSRRLIGNSACVVAGRVEAGPRLSFVAASASERTWNRSEKRAIQPGAGLQTVIARSPASAGTTKRSSWIATARPACLAMTDGLKTRPRGFPQSGAASECWSRCRYLFSGELERSLLKDRFLYEDAQLQPLARWRGQAPALPFLPARAGARIGCDARTAFARGGQRGVFTLSAVGGTTPVAVRTSTTSAGSVDASDPGRAAPAFSDGRNRCGQLSFRQFRRPGASRYRHHARSASDNSGRGCTLGSRCDGQTLSNQGSSGVAAR